MRYNKIMLFFSSSLIVSVILRFLQINFTIEAKTGFFITELKTYGSVLLVLILACAFLTAIFGYMTYKRPEKTPKVNIFMSISAFLLGLSILYEVMLEESPISVLSWQVMLLRLFGIGAAVYFLTFALTPIISLDLPPILSALPTAYLIIRMICDFTAISKLALISDNIIIIAVYCFMLLFFLNFAKLYNRIDLDLNFKKLLSFGLTSVLLCFTNSIPNILTNFISLQKYTHTSMGTNISVLFFGLFIISFLLSHFSRKNID